MTNYRILKKGKGWVTQKCTHGTCKTHIKYDGTGRDFVFSSFDSALDALTFKFKTDVILESKRCNKGDLI